MSRKGALADVMALAAVAACSVHGPVFQAKQKARTRWRSIEEAKRRNRKRRRVKR